MTDGADNLTVLYEDRHLIAVCKPARVPTGGDASGDDTVLAMARRRHEERQAAVGRKCWLAPVHFLDRPVSGVVLFALSSKAASRMAELFRNRRLEKVYWAVVEGVPEALEGELEHWLWKDEDKNRSVVCQAGDSGAKRCQLTFRRLAVDAKRRRSLLEVRPATGRSHQIRVQLAAMGWPIVGDLKYGATTGEGGAIALHAFRLGFVHPVSGATLRIEAPVPPAWTAYWSGAIVQNV